MSKINSAISAFFQVGKVYGTAGTPRALWHYHDPNGDAEGPTVVEWYVDDQELPAYTGTVEGTEGAYSFSTLPAALTARGQVWSFRVIPHDGAQSGPAADSRNPADAAGGSPRTVAIFNTPPSILSAEVAPANSGSNWHTNTYTAGNITHNDPDGDPVVIHYQWYSGGTDRIEADPVPGATGATFRPADHALTRYDAPGGNFGVTVRAESGYDPAFEALPPFSETDIEVVVISLQHYTVRYLAGAGGSISGITEQVVPEGLATVMVEAVAEPGALFDAWSDGITDPWRHDVDIQSDREYVARFVSLGGVPLDWYGDHGIQPADGEDWTSSVSSKSIPDRPSHSISSPAQPLATTPSGRPMIRTASGP